MWESVCGADMSDEIIITIWSISVTARGPIAVLVIGFSCALIILKFSKFIFLDLIKEKILSSKYPRDLEVSEKKD